MAGYHRNLVKQRMSPTEATQRVARALVLVIYRELSAVVAAQDTHTPVATQKKEGEGYMASGLTRSDQNHTSNISPSSLRTIKATESKRVKGPSARTLKKKKEVSKITA